jgi:hypothetical protein
MPPDATWPSDPWLTLALPGVWLAGYTLARGMAAGRRAASLLAPALAIAAWLATVHAVGRASGSFRAGLWVGTLVVAVAGLVAGVLQWRSRNPRRDGDPAPSPRLLRVLLTALAATAMLAPMALTWALHDEELITGHLSIAAEIARGVYPPRHLSFPQYELRYHYGFNLLTAVLSRLTGVGPGRLIDPITLAAWAYSWCLLSAIGARMVGPGGWLAAPTLTLLGGGLPWFVPGEAASGPHRLLGSVWVGRAPLNPPMLSYFFQHPWTLGVPLTLAAILIHVEPPPAGRAAFASRLAALALLIVALSQAQFVLFLGLAASLVVAEPLASGVAGLRPPRVAATVVVLGAAVAASSRIGGFFLPPPSGGDLGLEPTSGVAGGLVPSLLWLLGTFGVQLPLGVVGIVRARRGRLLLGLLAAGGLAVVNSVRYRYSADAAKFATVSALALGLGAAVVVARAFAARPKAVCRTLGGLLAAGCIAESLVFLVVFTFRPDLPPPDVFQRTVAALPPEHGPAVAWLRAHAARDEAVYVREDLALAYAERGGVPSAWFDVGTLTFGFPPWLLRARSRLLDGPADDPDQFLGQRVRWVALDEADRRLRSIVRRWVDAGRALEAARFGGVIILRILPPSRP